MRVVNYVLIDGFNMCARYDWRNLYYDGLKVSMLYDGVRALLRYFKEYRSAEVNILWDRGTSWRKQVWSGYKASRKKKRIEAGDGDDFIKRVEEFRHVVKALGVDQYYQDGMEADDLAAYIVHNYEYESLVLVSTDSDWYQLVTDGQNGRGKVTILSGKVELDYSAVKKKLGYAPQGMAVYKALKGDKADDISGIRGYPVDLAKGVANSVTDIAHLDNIPGLSEKEARNHRWLLDRNYEITLLDGSRVNPDLIEIDEGAYDDMLLMTVFGRYGMHTILSELGLEGSDAT